MPARGAVPPPDTNRDEAIAIMEALLAGLRGNGVVMTTHRFVGTATGRMGFSADFYLRDESIIRNATAKLDAKKIGARVRAAAEAKVAAEAACAAAVIDAVAEEFRKHNEAKSRAKAEYEAEKEAKRAKIKKKEPKFGWTKDEIVIPTEKKAEVK